MAEYIEREALLANFGEEPMVWDECDETEIQERWDWRRYSAIVKGQPAADVVEVRHGRWVWNSIDNPLHRICNQCGAVYRIVEGDFPYNVCPNCGAKMRGEKP